jgi:hypothetical protein
MYGFKQQLFWSVICFFLPLSATWATQVDTLSIFEATEQGKVLFMARGAYNPNIAQPDLPSAHYGKCVDVRIQNTTNETFAVKLETGTILVSKVNKAQNMLITKTTYCKLNPYEKCYGRVFALCAELNKNAPDIYVSYSLGKMATGTLYKLAKTIESEDAQNLAGQYAVWAVTDKATTKELGEKYEILEKSQQLLDKSHINFSIYGNKATHKTPDLTPTPKKVAALEDTVLTSYQVTDSLPSFQTTPSTNTVNTEEEQRFIQKNKDKGIRIGEIDQENEQNEWLLVGAACVLLLMFTALFFKFLR